jgi:hypothetical protein
MVYYIPNDILLITPNTNPFMYIESQLAWVKFLHNRNFTKLYRKTENMKKSIFYTPETEINSKIILANLRFRWAIWVLEAKFLKRYDNKFINNETIGLDTFNDNESVINIWDNEPKKYWRFRPRNIIQIIRHALLHTEDVEVRYIAKPIIPKNPYTNIDFSNKQIMSIYSQLGNLKLPLELTMYYNVSFRLKSLLVNYRLHFEIKSMQSYLKNLDEDEIELVYNDEIVRMHHTFNFNNKVNLDKILELPLETKIANYRKLVVHTNVYFYMATHHDAETQTKKFTHMLVDIAKKLKCYRYFKPNKKRTRQSVITNNINYVFPDTLEEAMEETEDEVETEDEELYFIDTEPMVSAEDILAFEEAERAVEEELALREREIAERELAEALAELARLDSRLEELNRNIAEAERDIDSDPTT